MMGGHNAGTAMHLMPKLQSMLDSVIDWFMPDRLRGDVLSERRIRMFLVSHIFGPVISHPITIMLMLYDPNPWPHVPILGASDNAVLGVFVLGQVSCRSSMRHLRCCLCRISSLRFFGVPTIMAAALRRS